MESTSVEDFQDYHNHLPVSETDELIHSSPSFQHETLPHQHKSLFDDDLASLSGSAHHSPDEAVFDNHHSHTSSPCTSDDDISVLESHYEPSFPKSPSFTPLKPRHAFRNPSSVRAMQMDTTPPHLASTRSPQQGYKLHTPSRQCTPRSVRSHRSAMSGSPSRMSPGKKMKKEYPLVLLHVTLLPLPLYYSEEMLESVLPPSILENWKLLQEKATDTVLERGILIPHPKEDYDLLEERLLESLELKIPRILKCGHFRLEPEEADIAADSDDDFDEDTDDVDICLDCGRRIHDGKFGSAGTGSKRWDIKLFAANGLMRAGAWSAAWREMERVDVEILPWMEEDMKRELELRREDAEERAAAAAAREEGVGGLDDERLREIYGGEARAFMDGMINETPATAEMAARQMNESGTQEDKWQGEVPLRDLMMKYLYHASKDRRNIVIFILSVLVAVLSMGSFGSVRGDSTAVVPASQQQLSTYAEPSLASGVTESTAGKPAATSSSTIESAPLTTASSISSTAAATSPSSTPSSSPKNSDTQPADENEYAESTLSSSWTETAGDEVSELIED